MTSLVDYFPEHQYVLYTPKKKLDFAREAAENVSVQMPTGLLAKNLSSVWRSFSMSEGWQKNNLDIFHGLSHEIPFFSPSSKVKKIVTIHDLSYLKYPSGFNWIDRKVYDAKFRFACKQSDMVVAISKSTANDVEKIYEIDPTKIRVIGQSANEVFYEDQDENRNLKTLKKFAISGPYLLSVGLHHERKNIERLVLAYHRSHKKYPLVLAGEPKQHGEKIENLVRQLGLEDKVKLIKSVTLMELQTLYAKALFTVYPSLYEGFGLPILESLLSGTPVLTSKGSCLEEVGAKAGLYFDPTDVDSMINVLNQASEELAQNLITHRDQAIAPYDPKKIADQFIGLYSSVLSS